MTNKLDVTRAIEMLGTGLTEGNVAQDLGVTLWGLKLALSEAGYQRPRKKPALAPWATSDDANVLGTANLPSEKAPSEEDSTIVGLYLRGLSLTEVGLLTGRSETPIRRVLQRQGIACRSYSEANKLRFQSAVFGTKTVRQFLAAGLTRGEVASVVLELGTVRLDTEDRDAEIIRLYKACKTQVEISKKLRIAERTVRKVLRAHQVEVLGRGIANRLSRASALQAGGAHA